METRTNIRRLQKEKFGEWRKRSWDEVKHSKKLAEF